MRRVLAPGMTDWRSVSAVWPDLRTESAQAKRRKESKQSKLKVHATERAEYRFWDHWLTDGREPHVMICDIASAPKHTSRLSETSVLSEAENRTGTKLLDGGKSRD